MALTKTLSLTSSFGQASSFDDAYIKVERVDGTKDAAKASVSIYKSAGGDRLASENHEFTPDMDGPNFIKQAYISLKAGAYAGAVDA